MKRYEFTVGGMRGTLDGAWVRYDEASAITSKTLDLFARSEIDHDKLLAAMKELTDRLAQVENRNLDLQRMVGERVQRLENERDSFKAIAEKWCELDAKHMRQDNALREERDELRTALRACIRIYPELKGMGNVQHAIDISEPRDTSAEQGGVK